MTGYFAGLDIGASFTKCVVIDERETIRSFAILPTGFDFEERAREVFEQAKSAAGGEVVRTCSTGYGRKNVGFADLSKTEITCQSLGCFKEFGGAATIVDIGGQDVKIIRIDQEGKRVQFKMNRKCAAGTGAFLEEIAFKIKVPVDELNDLAQSATGEISLGSFCTVFTATEILSHLRAQVPLSDIVRGILRSVAKRVSNMDSFSAKVVFTGGLARRTEKVNVLAEMIAEETGSDVWVPPHPQITCAYGAALVAKENA
jgi:predicted CoA-substrate-specific enzyme activase